jgi:hypothetical protein
MKVVNIPSTKTMKKLVRRVNTGTRHFAEQMSRNACEWNSPRHMWTAPIGKLFLTSRTIGLLRSYVRPFGAGYDRWP